MVILYTPHFLQEYQPSHLEVIMSNYLGGRYWVTVVLEMMSEKASSMIIGSQNLC